MKSGWKLLFDGDDSKGWRGAYKDGISGKGLAGAGWKNYRVQYRRK